MPGKFDLKREYTDMHCHLLPGLDDGAVTSEETLALIDAALSQGIHEIVVTPHFHPGRYQAYANLVHKSLQTLRESCLQSGRDIVLYCGQECYYYSGLIDELRKGNALTMGESDYVLVEFEPDVYYSALETALRQLRQNGYRPVLAHFERYACLYNHRDRIEELRARGVLLQLNFDRLAEKDTLFHRNIWRRYLLEGYVDLLGSDSHGIHFRPLHFDRVRAWIEKEMSSEMRETIFHRNFDRIIGKKEREK